MGRPAVLKIDILADAKGVGKGVDDADGALGRLGKGAKLAGAAVVAGLAVGVAAVGAFAASAVGEASHVEQAMGGLDAVFGRNAGQVKTWARDAATAVGLSKAQYADLAAVIGAQLTGAGMSLDQATAKTNQLVTMGADLAATFGGTTKDAVDALSSALKGEMDPIERYGISLKQSDINARLAAQGQDKLTGTALKTATAQAALDLITQASAKSHGQFASQTGTLGEQQQILGAQFDNVKAKVGSFLLPVLTSLFQFATTQLAPGLQRLAQTGEDYLAPMLDKVGGFVRDKVVPAATVMATYFRANVLPTFATVAQFIGSTVVPALMAIAGFILDKVVPAVTRLAGPVLGGLRSVVGSVTGALVEHKEQFAAVGGAIAAVMSVVLKVAPVIGTVLGGALKVVGVILGGVLDVIAAVIAGVEKAIGVIGRLADAAKGVGSFIGKLNPFSAVELAGRAAPLVGPGTSYQLAPGLANAALGGSPLALLAAAGPAPSGRSSVTVDARTFVTIDGALDPVAVAAQLETILRDQAVRLGRVTTGAAA